MQEPNKTEPQTFSFSYKEWGRTLNRVYAKDGCKTKLRVKRNRRRLFKKEDTFRCKLNEYVIYAGRINKAGGVESITAIGSSDGAKDSGKAMLYGFILLINSLFPDYDDKDIVYILKHLKLLGKKRVQSNSSIAVDGVHYKLHHNQVGVMLTVTPHQK